MSMHTPNTTTRPPRRPRSRSWGVVRMLPVLWFTANLLMGCDRPAKSPVPKPGSRPNVILLVVDTLRADRLGCYGDPRGLTPTMDELATQGMPV